MRIHPTAVLEPTCGQGSFIRSSLIFDAKEYYGIEINPDYCETCRNSIQDERVRIIHADFFAFSSKQLIQDQSRVLIIGNPPWVTNSDLSAGRSNNIPEKFNFKKLRGFDAITGASNFDICEFMILQLIEGYQNTNAVIAMLCKTSVAQNIFLELKRKRIPFASCRVLKFDAAREFGVCASACVLVIQLSEREIFPEICDVYDFEKPDSIQSQFGFSNGRFYSNLKDDAQDYDGNCCFQWRQGVKHDCSSVMELTLRNGTLQNKINEPVNIEPDFVFPLVKSSMFKSPLIHSFSKYVIVTQRKIREETLHLKTDAPETWKYLSNHIGLFEKRKSSIYRGTPPFSMFGVGDYSYSRYKVGISGFYKKPLFSILYSDDAKPVMTDDTSYFIPFDSYEKAYVAMLLLNSEKVQKFLSAIAFLDEKRPYTKRVLERIDFYRITDTLSLQDLKATESALQLEGYVTDGMYHNFRSMLEQTNPSGLLRVSGKRRDAP